MITVNVDNAEVSIALERLIAGHEDLSPLMRNIAGILEYAVEENFAAGGRPAWEPLSTVTTGRRSKRGTWPGQMLQESGRLAASVVSESGRNFARVGTNDQKAATHQFGAAKGQFGKTKHGVPIPWGDIPARPFLALDESDLSEIGRAAIDYAASFTSP